MYFWIIKNNATGQIGTGSGTHAPDEILAPAGFSLIGPYDDANNPMPADFEAAYNEPSKHLYQNGQFSSQPYLSLTTSTPATPNGNVTITATLSNPPATPPSAVNFTVLEQVYTETISGNEASLTLNIHPAVAGQAINVTASAPGCVDASTNIGGNGTTVAAKIVMTTTPNTISPVYRKDGEAYYAGAISPESLFADIGTSNSLNTHFIFEKVPAAMRLLNKLLTWAQQPTYSPLVLNTNDQADVTTITLSADEQNALADIQTNLFPSLYTTLKNAYPSGGAKQRQYERYVIDAQTTYNSFADYDRDISVLGWI